MAQPRFYTHLLPRDVHHALMLYLDAVDVVSYAEHLHLGPEPTAAIDVVSHHVDANERFWTRYGTHVRTGHDHLHYAGMRDSAANQRARLRELRTWLAAASLFHKIELLQRHSLEFSTCHKLYTRLSAKIDLAKSIYELSVTLEMKGRVLTRIVKTHDSSKLIRHLNCLANRCSSVPQMAAMLANSSRQQTSKDDDAFIHEFALAACACPAPKLERSARTPRHNWGDYFSDSD